MTARKWISVFICAILWIILAYQGYNMISDHFYGIALREQRLKVQETNLANKDAEILQKNLELTSVNASLYECLNQPTPTPCTPCPTAKPKVAKKTAVVSTSTPCLTPTPCPTVETTTVKTFAESKTDVKNPMGEPRITFFADKP